MSIFGTLLGFMYGYKEGSMSTFPLYSWRMTAPELEQHRKAFRPDLEQLEIWEETGGCECSGPCQCWIEPDGTCPNGYPSWLVVLGLI